MSFYKELVEKDIVTLAEPLLQSGYYMRDVDDKIEAKTHVGYQTPWIHVNMHPKLNCGMWHQIQFNSIGSMLPAGRRFVPSNCQECYKVVVRPRTVKALFAMEALQEKMGVPSKCGIEVRETVHALYGGYFYTQGVQEGIERFEHVIASIADDELLSPAIIDDYSYAFMPQHILDNDNVMSASMFAMIKDDIDKSSGTKVLLKRACTEFEAAFGDSSKWEVTEDQKKIESMIEDAFVVDLKKREQPEIVKLHVHRKWIEYAYMNGDSTAIELNGGQPLYAPYVTYHHMLGEYYEQKDAFESDKSENVEQVGEGCKCEDCKCDPVDVKDNTPKLSIGDKVRYVGTEYESINGVGEILAKRAAGYLVEFGDVNWYLYDNDMERV